MKRSPEESTSGDLLFLQQLLQQHDHFMKHPDRLDQTVVDADHEEGYDDESSENCDIVPGQ